MVPCKFVDLNDGEEIIDSTREQSPASNNKPKNLQKDDIIWLDNYWLNEIKSQEDTARQIATLSILLLVASFTFITTNSDRIFKLLNDTRPYVPGTSSYNSLVPHIISDNFLSYFESFSFLLTIIGIFGFFLIWVLALKASIKALELELNTSNDGPHSRRLAYIASIKQTHCKNAVNIIISGMVLFSIFVIGFIIAIAPLKGWLEIGSLIMFTSIVGVLLVAYFLKIQSAKGPKT